MNIIASNNIILPGILTAFSNKENNFLHFPMKKYIIQILILSLSFLFLQCRENNIVNNNQNADPYVVYKLDSLSMYGAGDTVFMHTYFPQNQDKYDYEVDFDGYASRFDTALSTALHTLTVEVFDEENNLSNSFNAEDYNSISGHHNFPVPHTSGFKVKIRIHLNHCWYYEYIKLSNLKVRKKIIP